MSRRLLVDWADGSESWFGCPDDFRLDVFAFDGVLAYEGPDPEFQILIDLSRVRALRIHRPL